MNMKSQVVSMRIFYAPMGSSSTRHEGRRISRLAGKYRGSEIGEMHKFSLIVGSFPDCRFTLIISGMGPKAVVFLLNPHNKDF